MSKKSNFGIIRYGKRRYSNPVKKLQEGGSVGVSLGYDWRDDPYELMLIQQREREKNTRIRANAITNRGRSRSSASSKTSKLPKIDPITNGLEGSVRVANTIIDRLHNNYLTNIQEQGPEYIGSIAGQHEINNIIKSRETLAYKTKSEKENFDSALESIPAKDRGVYAISSEGNIMVSEGGDINRVKRITLEDYTNNLTKYVPLTVDEFATWRKTNDESLNRGYEEEFLKKAGVDAPSIYKDLIKPFEKQLDYAIENNKLVYKTGTSEETQWITKNFSAAFNQMLSGGESVNSRENLSKDQQAIFFAANKIFNSVLDNTSDRNKLTASLQAEALKDNRFKQLLINAGTPEKRAALLNNQVKRLLINKIVGGSTSTTSDSTTSGGSSALGKAKHNMGLTSILDFSTGTKLDKYRIGQTINTAGGDNPADDRNVYFTAPMKKNALSNNLLKINESPENEEDYLQNTVIKNSTINEIADTDNIYGPDGELVKDTVNKDFLTDSAVISNTDNVDVVMLPYSKEKGLLLKDVKKLNDIKNITKRAFLKAYNTREQYENKPNLAGINPDGIVKGSYMKQEKDAYKEYRAWIELGSRIEDIRKQSKESPNDARLKEDLVQAELAAQAISNASKNMDALFGGPVYLKEFISVKVIFDDDSHDYIEKFEENIKRNNFGSKEMIKKATPQQIRYIDDINGIDHTALPFSDVWETSFLIPMKSAEKQAAQKNEKVESVQAIKEVSNMFLEEINSNSPISNPSIKNTIPFLIN